jgi:hypothetical protein
VIVGSLLLIVVAVGLLVVGLLQGANALLVASIAASLLAAVALILGGRQVAAARRSAAAQTRSRSGAGDRARAARDLDHEELPVEEVRRSRREPVGAGVGAGVASGLYGQAAADETSMLAPVREEEPYRAEPYASVPHQGYGAGPALDDDEDDDYDEDEPDDEPAPEMTSATDRARVSQLTNDVYVVDGRPRYHLRECVHLLGRESEALPVGEANELGFTPCGACEPDATLIAAARRR